MNTEPVPWFCSSCTAHNSAEADRCSNLKCNLLRKVSGVDLVPGSERPFAVPIVSCEKQKRCGECDGCKAPECGLCGMCLDMPKRGGKGTKKQPCELRVCVRVRKGAEERLEERAEEHEADRRRRELERAKREADRLARIEAMAEERRQKHESKQAERQAKQEAKQQAQLARARAAMLRKATAAGGRQKEAKPPVFPSDLPAYGWGVRSSYPVGMPVEVLGVDEGLAGACFRALVAEPCESDLPNRPNELPPPPDPAVLLPAAMPGAAGAAAAGAAAAGAATGTAAAEGDPGSPSAPHSGGGAASSSGIGGVGGIGGDGRLVSEFEAAPASWMLVEHLDLFEGEEDGSPRLREWVSSEIVRPRPPDPPRGYLSLARARDKMQFLLEDTYWDVHLESFGAGAGATAAAGVSAAAGASTDASAGGAAARAKAAGRRRTRRGPSPSPPSFTTRRTARGPPTCAHCGCGAA